MDTHQVRVGGEPYITLEGIGTFGDRTDVRLEGLLWQVLAGSPVGNDPRSPVGWGPGTVLHPTILSSTARNCGTTRVRPGDTVKPWSVRSATDLTHLPPQTLDSRDTAALSVPGRRPLARRLSAGACPGRAGRR